MTHDTQTKLAELEATIRKAQEEVAALKAELAKPEKKEWVNPVFVPERGYSKLYNIHTDPHEGMFSEIKEQGNSNGRVKYAFRTAESAQAYADAFQVMLELRSQPGQKVYTKGEAGWVTSVSNDGTVFPTVCGLPSAFTISGAFDSEESTKAAIKAVGEARIRRAVDTLIGRGCVMTTHRQRMAGITNIVNTADTSKDDVVKLRVALARIMEAANSSEKMCKTVASEIPWKYGSFKKGFGNLATHFSYISDIAKEATNDQ